MQSSSSETLFADFVNYQLANNDPANGSNAEDSSSGVSMNYICHNVNLNSFVKDAKYPRFQKFSVIG